VNDVDVILTPERLAERLDGITEKTLADWRYKGTGPRFFRAGKRVFYREGDVDAWLAGRVEAQDAKRAS
jgi:hypothetical protein